MAGQRIGYMRVSALDQNEKRQLEGQVLELPSRAEALKGRSSRAEVVEQYEAAWIENEEHLPGSGTAGRGSTEGAMAQSL